jgi:nucleoside 2-deoxyribosyltransferase
VQSSSHAPSKHARLYVAAPLFSAAEQAFNLDLALKLGRCYSVFLPQREGRLIGDLMKAGMSPHEAARTVFEVDTAAIRQCDVLIAVLDGRAIDEGVAFELGMAFSLGKKCVGLQTDIRRLLPTGNNPMIECALPVVVDSVDELLTRLEGSSALPTTVNVATVALKR